MPKSMSGKVYLITAFMNNVASQGTRVWYRLYWWVMLVAGLLVWGGSLAVRFVPQFQNLGMSLGFGTKASAIAGLLLVYLLSVYFWVSKRDRTVALLFGSMFFTLMLLYGINLTDPSAASWGYAGTWLLSVFLVGMLGRTYSFGSVLLPAIYILLKGDFNFVTITTQAWTLLGGSVVMATAGYFFWKNVDSKAGQTQLDQLTGMLRTKDEQAAILIQSIADGVVVTNTDGKITIMNRSAANMTGWPVEEASGINVDQVFKIAKEKGEEIPREEYPFTAVLSHKAFFNQVLQLTSRNGQKQIISLVISPVVTPRGEVFGTVAVLRDISEQRAAEAQRAEFISTASHEMRTPVAAIEGYLSLALNEKVSTIDSRARGYLEKAHSSTQHLGQLFQDLLTSAKAEDGRLSNHPAVVEMGQFLEQLVEDLRFGAQKKGLGTDFIIGSSDAIDATKEQPGGQGIKVVKPLYYVYVDPDRIREVITNLFDNGCKYTDSGKVSVGLTGNNEVVQIYIRDTGAGIPPEDVPHLFQKFYRVDNSATRTIGGTGLGLFIARKIVELYRGRIWVESELGKGSTFFINLPRLTSQKAQELQTAAAALPANASAASTTPSAPAAQAGVPKT